MFRDYDDSLLMDQNSPNAFWRLTIESNNQLRTTMSKGWLKERMYQTSMIIPLIAFFATPNDKNSIIFIGVTTKALKIL